MVVMLLSGKRGTLRIGVDHLIGKLFNPSKCSGVRWLHFKVFNAIQVKATF